MFRCSSMRERHPKRTTDYLFELLSIGDGDHGMLRKVEVVWRMLELELLLDQKFILRLKRPQI